MATEDGGRLRPPEGLRCGGKGGIVSLKRPDVLGEGNDVGGSCANIMEPLIQRQREERERMARLRRLPAPGLGVDDCQRLPPG